MKDTFFSKKKVLNVRGKIHKLESPWVMGILNLTPDSFYDGGRYNSASSALERAEVLYEEGAMILDLGAYSSRPGAENISEEQEWARLSEVIRAIKKQFPDKLLSIDTFRAEIARRSLEEGADLINDISGGHLDASIVRVAAKYKVPYIAMHMKGTPDVMQGLTQYDQLLYDIMAYFVDVQKKAQEEGLTDLIFDPGFGFAKTLGQNFTVFEQMDALKIFQQIILIGVSRKSMIYKSLNVRSEDALNGTTALHMAALMKGADILRVHDVKEAIESITLYNQMKR